MARLRRSAKRHTRFWLFGSGAGFLALIAAIGFGLVGKQDADHIHRGVNRLLSISDPDFNAGERNGGPGHADAGTARSSASVLIEQARKLHLTGNEDAALAALDRATKMSPDLSDAYLERGLIYASKGDTNRALSEFDAALQRNQKNGKAFEERAAIRRSQGDYSAAVEDYSSAIAIAARPELLVARGLLRYVTGAFSPAMDDYNEALRLQKNLGEALAWRALTEIFIHDFDAARDDLQTVSSVAPGFEDGYAVWGIYYSFMGDETAADLAFDQALRFSSDHAAAYTYRALHRKLKNKTDTSLADLQRAISLGNRNVFLPIAYLIRGTIESDKGNDDAAMRDLEQASRGAPFLWEPHFLLGRILRKRNILSTAILELTTAAQLGPAALGTYYERGLAYLAADEGALALNDFKHALLGGKTAELLTLRGKANLAIGKATDALNDLDEAVTLDSRYAPAFAQRALAKAYSNFGLVSAMRDAEQALKLSPDDVDALSARAVIFHMKGDFLSAFADANKAITKGGAPADAFAVRGGIYLNRGDADHALADFDAWVGLRPGLANAIHYRGRAYRMKGNLNRALDDFRLAINLNEPSKDFYFEASEVLELLGRFSEALEVIEDAYELWPKDSEILNSRCWAKIPLKRFAEALTDCDASLAILDAPLTRDSRGHVLLKLGRYDEANGEFTKVLGNRGLEKRTEASSYFGRSLARRKMGRVLDANEDLAKAVRAQPDIIEYMRGIGIGI